SCYLDAPSNFKAKPLHISRSRHDALPISEDKVGNPLLPADYDIIWSAVCFIIIFVVVWRVALPRVAKVLDARSAAIEGNIAKARSEEHTSELQSRENIVCRRLLEK